MATRESNRGISRRDFIKLAAAAGLLAGCSPAEQQDAAPTNAPTNTPANTPTSTPTRAPASTPTRAPTSTPTSTPTSAPTSAPTSTPASAPTNTPANTPTVAPSPTGAIRRPEIIKTYPDVPSKVVHARRADVRDGDALVPEVIRHMLDASIAELTGLNDALEAWAALFSPDERIAIKVNAHARGSVHVPLVVAVTECLQAAGVPAEQILIFDRYSTELEDEGYPVNVDGPGVRCYGTDIQHYRSGWTLMDTDIKLSDLMLSCDALINIPILKVANGPGISFALKNHYGTFDKPSSFHRPKFERAIAELNALPPIRERTRLVIGDVLSVGERRDTAGFRMIGTGDAILMSFDPVAHDTVGLQLASQVLDAEGSSTEATTSQATAWLENAAQLGLGTDDADHMEWVEVTF